MIDHKGDIEPVLAYLDFEEVRRGAKDALKEVTAVHQQRSPAEIAVQNIKDARTILNDGRIRTFLLRRHLVVNLAPWYRLPNLAQFGSYSRIDFFNPPRGPMNGPMGGEFRGSEDPQGLYYMRPFQEGDGSYIIPHPLTPRLVDALWSRDLDRSMVRYWAGLKPDRFAKILDRAII